MKKIHLISATDYKGALHAAQMLKLNKNEYKYIPAYEEGRPIRKSLRGVHNNDAIQYVLVGYFNRFETEYIGRDLN